MSDLNRSRENGLKGKFKGLLDYFMGADLPNDERPGGSRFTGMPQLTGEATPLVCLQCPIHWLISFVFGNFRM